MKSVVLTGASKGLGLSIASKLLENGYLVIGISRSKSQKFEALMSQYPDQLLFKPFDFSKTDEIHELVSGLIKGTGRPYALINNAALGHDGVLGTMHESQIKDLISVNVEAPILLTKYCSRAMLIQGEGRVINIGSIIGSTGFNGLSVYGATKAAMQGFTRSLSRELGKVGITVNTVAPGYMETDMTSGLQGKKLESIKRRSALGRLANVEDVANMVVYLLSKEASAITGATLTVDAGSTA